MRQAVQDWDNKQGVYMEMSPEKRTLKKFAARVKIPYETMRKYTASDPEKRRQLGIPAGRQWHLNDYETEFVASVLRRRDRANDGMDRQAGIDMVQDLKPKMSREQAARAFDQMRRDHEEVLTRIVWRATHHTHRTNRNAPPTPHLPQRTTHTTPPATHQLRNTPPAMHQQQHHSLIPYQTIRIPCHAMP